MSKGLHEDRDGYLVWNGGDRYRMPDPPRAMKVYRNGVMTPGCAHPVSSMWNTKPCGKTPKHDPDAQGRMTKCGHHSAAADERRKAKSQAKMAEWRAQWKRRDAISKAANALEPALRQIAGGHNDPRQLAIDIIAALDAARKE